MPTAASRTPSRSTWGACDGRAAVTVRHLPPTLSSGAWNGFEAVSNLYRLDGDALIVVANVATVNELNQTGWTWHRRKSYREGVRRIVALTLLTVPKRLKPTLPCKVLMTRFSAGSLDKGAGIWAAMKSVQDELAGWLGVDDADPSVEWDVAQAKARRGQCWTECRIERRT